MTMEGRKKWDRPSNIPIQRVGANQSEIVDEQPNSIQTQDPVLEKQRQYIKMLEERNRLKKKLEETSKSKQIKDILVERENAFVTTFNVETTTRNVSLPRRGVIKTKLDTSKDNVAQNHNKHFTYNTKGRTAKSAPVKKLSYVGSKHRARSLSESESSNEDETVSKPIPDNVQFRTHDPLARKSKWSRPDGSMQVQTLLQNGKATFCLGEVVGDSNVNSIHMAGKAVPKYEDEIFELQGGKSNEIKALDDSNDDATESDKDDCDYLDESFEEFEDNGSNRGSSGKELVLIEPLPDDIKTNQISKSSTSKVTDDESLSMSSTTIELFQMIQNLSRSKQKKLTRVLQQFQDSKQENEDKDLLRDSIGDPKIWDHLTGTVFKPMEPTEDKSTNPTTESLLTVESKASVNSRVEKTIPPVIRSMILENAKTQNDSTTESLYMGHPVGAHTESSRSPKAVTINNYIVDEEQELEQLLQKRRQARKAQSKSKKGSNATSKGLYFDKNNETMADTKTQNISIGNLSCELQAQSKANFGADTILNLLPLDNGKPSCHNNICVRLISTWGATRAFGLTQITPFDTCGNEINVDVESIKLFNGSGEPPLPQSNEMVRGLKRLFVNPSCVYEEQDTWRGRIPDTGVLTISFGVEGTPGKLRIWNDVRQLCSSSIRDIEILINNRCVYIGSLPERFNNDTNKDLCHWLSLTIDDTEKKIEDFPSTEKSYHMFQMPSPKESYKGLHTSSTLSSPRIPEWLSSSGSKRLESAVSAMNLLNFDKIGSHEVKSERGSLTSRPRCGEISKKFLNNSEGKEDKENIDLAVKKQQEDSMVHLKSLSSLTTSWDTLESFSKTNRSRLVQPPIGKYGKSESSLNLASTYSQSMDKPVTTSISDITPKLGKIPILPSGRYLRLDIVSTWGDFHYVGLNGIDVFDYSGQPIRFKNPEQQVMTMPTNLDTEFKNDPRRPTNLVDGVNCTCDELHMWLAPFSAGGRLSIVLDLGKTMQLSMVRIWNYNQSRSHTSRGVQRLRMSLSTQNPTIEPNSFQQLKENEDKYIFDGEIRQAPGVLITDSYDLCCEVILFTRDPKILDIIELNDTPGFSQPALDAQSDEEISKIGEARQKSIEEYRPVTSDGNRDTSSIVQPSVNLVIQTPNSIPQSKIEVTRSEHKSVIEYPVESIKNPETAYFEQNENRTQLLKGRVIHIQLLTTWGDIHYIGLSQLEILVGKTGMSFPLSLSNINASPRDLATLGSTGDPRTLDKLIDGKGTTTDDTHMWLIPYDSKFRQFITIDLKTNQNLYGLRFWNYNKSPEDTYRGVKNIYVSVDGVLISPKGRGHILRKAPGHSLFDFGQEVKFPLAPEISEINSKVIESIYPFNLSSYKAPLLRQDYQPPYYPQGFSIKFVFWSTWGDPYYLGLNGIELYDYENRRITSKFSVYASPYSITDILPQEKQSVADIRIPSNLLSGKNKNTWDCASDTWLSPLASSLGSNSGNIVYIVFDTPIVLSMIKIWNYNKSRERGVKDVDIFIDDTHIYSGRLRIAPLPPPVHFTGRVEDFCQSILFTATQSQVDAEKRRVYYCGQEEQDVLCINERQIMQSSKSMYNKPSPSDEGVVIDLDLRPTTALCK